MLPSRPSKKGGKQCVVGMGAAIVKRRLQSPIPHMKGINRNKTTGIVYLIN
jgi:hypothetical protein